MPAQLYYKAQQLRELTRQQVFAALQQADVLACLVLQNERCRRARVCTAKRRRTSVWRGAAVSRACLNLANVPALRVPCGFASVDGQDCGFGLQLAGGPLLMDSCRRWHTLMSRAPRGIRVVHHRVMFSLLQAGTMESAWDDTITANSRGPSGCGLRRTKA